MDGYAPAVAGRSRFGGGCPDRGRRGAGTRSPPAVRGVSLNPERRPVYTPSEKARALELADKLGATAAEVVALLEGTAARVRAPALEEPACRDPDDDRVLALALAFLAGVLVTGDEELLVLHPWRGIPTLRPRDFWPLDRAASG